MTVQLRDTARVTGENGIIITLPKLINTIKDRSDPPFIKEVKFRAANAFWEVTRCGNDQVWAYTVALGLPGFTHYLIPFQLRSSTFSEGPTFQAWEYARDGLTRYEFFDDIGMSKRESFDIKLWQETIAPAYLAAGFVPKGFTSHFLPHITELLEQQKQENERYQKKATSTADVAKH